MMMIQFTMEQYNKRAVIEHPVDCPFRWCMVASGFRKNEKPYCRIRGRSHKCTNLTVWGGECPLVSGVQIRADQAVVAKQERVRARRPKAK